MYAANFSFLNEVILNTVVQLAEEKTKVIENKRLYKETPYTE